MALQDPLNRRIGLTGFRNEFSIRKKGPHNVYLKNSSYKTILCKFCTSLECTNEKLKDSYFEKTYNYKRPHQLLYPKSLIGHSVFDLKSIKNHAFKQST